MERFNDGPVFADERQDRIAELVAARGKVRIARLTEMFGVSEPTLRKDLSALEKRGLLKRTHGGAVSVRPPAEMELTARAVHQAEAKRAIAVSCLEEIRDGESVFLDGGTTVEQIARSLATTGRYVTVLTNAPAVAEILAETPSVGHVLLGGQLRRISGCLIGPLTLENLQRFTIDAAFIGAGGVSESGITVADLGEAHLKAAVIERAQRVILPIDHGKIGVSDFTRVCSPEDIDVLVTNQTDDYLKKISENYNVRLVTAS